jgi:hypothetical protein
MLMTVQRLREALESNAVEEMWKSSLDAYQEGTPQYRSDLAQWIMDVRANFLSHLDDVGDDSEELLISVALGFIEMKSQWQMLNTQINYQVFRKGEANTYMTYKSSLLSVLVDAIGQFLTPEDLEKIQEFLLNPTATAL